MEPIRTAPGGLSREDLPLSPTRELPVIRLAYDLALWLLPKLGRLPRQHRHLLGDLLARNAHSLLQGLVEARFRPDKHAALLRMSGRLDAIRYQLRMLLDLGLIDLKRYEYAARQMAEIGRQLGAWTRSVRS